MSEDNQETMTAAVTTAVMDAIEKRDHARSEEIRISQADDLYTERAAKKFLGIRDIVVAVGFFATLIGGGVLAFSELQDKPTDAEVEAAINAKVDPIIQRVGPLEDTAEVLTDNVERMQSLQEMQMQHAEWRADVADCRARNSCKRAPPEPQSLKDKKRELMTNQHAR